MSLDVASVMRWMLEILDLHSANPAARGGRAVLVPSIVPERERWTPFLAGIFEAQEGVLVDATRCGRSVVCGDPAVDCPDLIDSITATLAAYNDIHPDAELLLEVSRGSAQVRGAALYESANAAQRAFREIITAMLSVELRSADFVGVIYAGEALDENHLELVWSLLMRLPELLGLSKSSTLVVISGDGDVSFSVHCDGDPSLRFRLDASGRVQRRHLRRKSLEPMAELVRHSRTAMPLCVMFLGAGASTAAGLPSGDLLRNRALAGLTGRVVDWGTFDFVAREWWESLAQSGSLSAGELGSGVKAFVDGLTLERVIEEEQRRENQSFSTTLREFARLHEEAYRDLTDKRDAGGLSSDGLKRLMEHQSRLVIVTVNFDRLIEARVEDTQTRSFVTEADMAHFAEYLEHYASVGGPTPILKLHGDIDMPETLVANIDQTMAGLSVARETAMQSLIGRIDAQAVKPWWYIGYSMRDRDLETTWKSTKFSHFNEFWVAPLLDVSVENFIRANRMRNWELAGRHYTPEGRLVTLTAKEFFDLLADKVSHRWL